MKIRLVLIIFAGAALLFAACQPSVSTPTLPARQSSPCGDGICEGPENAQNCPQDCQAKPTAQVQGTQAQGTQAQATQALQTSEDACQNPNPKRAVISEELLDWYDWLTDGSFEQGNAEVVLADFPQGKLKRGTAERSQLAAHTGSWGYAITTGSDEGLIFSVKFFMEKGENTRFSFWTRSAGGQVQIKPTVDGVDFAGGQFTSTPIYSSDHDYPIGSEWTQVIFETSFSHANDYALFSLAIPPNTDLYVDDMKVEFPIWKMASYSGNDRMVGGIPVPNEPVAPVHIDFLIHIEDPAQIQINESFFQQKTAVFRELARTFHEHGGFLTIQPEEDWVMAANQFAPDTLSDLVRADDVVFSTHTHGPHCRDDQGRLRSYADCNANMDTPGWDHSINDYEYPYVVEYVGNLSHLISEAAGIPVTDHNGNWEFDQASRFSEIPMLTWSAYKAWRTQETYDYLINNPWRPTQVSADENIETFLTHDPDTQMIYVPGWGQAITRHPERLLSRIAPILSQFIYYADPQRVNSFYVVMHVDHFYSRAGNANYITYEPATGKVTYSPEFQQHIAYVDQMLTTLIDPLVQAGYVQWTSLPEIGALYTQWESNCR